MNIYLIHHRMLSQPNKKMDSVNNKHRFSPLKNRLWSFLVDQSKLFISKLQDLTLIKNLLRQNSISNQTVKIRFDKYIFTKIKN